jgi:hypothetical protein
MSEVPLRAASFSDLEEVAKAGGALADLCGSDASSQVAQNHFVHESGLLLCQRISMLNHSCVPNASIRLDESEDRATVVLARDVEAEEEIAFCYTSAAVLFAARDVRQAELRSHWGFVCRCARCSDTLMETEADLWRTLESAALSARNATPRGAVVDPSVCAQQRDAYDALEAALPQLCERDRFRFDAEYFA